MTGSESQIEWAERIKPLVNAEFDRVAQAFHVVASHQGTEARLETGAVIAILEEKRAEAMGQDAAGYFIREWGEMKDQVRRMIAADPRYQAMQEKSAAAKTTHTD